MYAITGITGQVGGALGNALLKQGLPVRAVVRDAGKGALWAARGCDVALADMNDASALTTAFAGADAVFILPPSEFDPTPGYTQARETIDAIVAALTAARPAKVLCLSTIGADAVQDNLLTQRTLIEQALGALPIPVTFLRPGWFLENALWDVASARDDGVIHSFLMPLDKPVAMVATKDIGAMAATLIQQDWTGNRVVELEGPSELLLQVTAGGHGEGADELLEVNGAILVDVEHIEDIVRKGSRVPKREELLVDLLELNFREVSRGAI